MGNYFSKTNDDFNSYDLHEALIEYEGDPLKSDSEKNCDKPHNYKNVNEFQISDIPFEERDEILLELIKSIAKITVKINVNKCSEERDKFYKKVVKTIKDTDQTLDVSKIVKDTDQRVDVSKIVKDTDQTVDVSKIIKGIDQTADVSKTSNGTDKTVVDRKVTKGTGRITGVTKTELMCLCSRCKQQEASSRKIKWIVKIFTATHVVFNNEEALQTTCSFVLDSDQEEVLCGTEVRWANAVGDLCCLNCETCDESLIKKLQSEFDYFNQRWLYFNEIKEVKNDKKLIQQKSKPLVIIVSYPHGLSKKVSIGHIQSAYYFMKGYKITYDACTCKGSSGAPVYVLGMNWFDVEFVHSGSLTNNTNGNFSSLWYF